MSKNIFINNLDTYVSQAIFKELRNDQPDPETGEAPESSNNIFGTFIGKDSSLKPEGIKKMLKVSERTFNLRRQLQPQIRHLNFTRLNMRVFVEIKTELGEELRLKVWPDCVWSARW